MGVLDVKKVLVAKFYNEDEELVETIIYTNVSEKEIEKEVDLLARSYHDHSIVDHKGLYCLKCNNADNFQADSISEGTAHVNSDGDFVDWIDDGTSDPAFSNFICSECEDPALSV